MTDFEMTRHVIDGHKNGGLENARYVQATE